MIKILDEAGKNILTTISITEMHQQDWEQLVFALDQKARQSGAVRWCWEIRDFGRNSGESDLEGKNALARLGAGSFERIALVGDKSLQGWLKAFVRPFSAAAEIRFFETIYQDEAHAWIRN